MSPPEPQLPQWLRATLRLRELGTPQGLEQLPGGNLIRVNGNH